jgi:ORF6N domain
MKRVQLVLSDRIERRIFLLRGQRVMFDRDLAELYGVETKYLNRQVRRNRERFPREFMFQVTNKERNELVTNWHRFASLKYSSVLPYAFTEHGVAMISSILHSKRAIHINILIIKVFVKLREILTNHKELALRLKELEMRINQHDDSISAIFEAIRQLMVPPEKPKRPIGF